MHPVPMDLIDLVVRGDVAGVRGALASGASPDASDSQGFTALHGAAQQYEIEIMRELVTAGADVNAYNVHGNTPLWTAVFNSNGRGAAIEILLERGGDPDLRNNAGRSPRDLAATIANYDVSQFLTR